MKHDPLRRRILDLRAELKCRGQSCPICHKDMPFGYLTGNWMHLIWWPKGKKVPRVILNPQAKCLDFQHILPSYLCENCRFVITQYKIPHNVTFGSLRSLEDKNHASNECPYCDGRKAKGVLIPTVGPYMLPHICWKEKIGSLFKRGRRISLTATLAYKGHLLTDKCKNCGLLFSTYDPNKIRRSNRIGFIFWGLLFVVMIVLLLSILN